MDTDYFWYALIMFLLGLTLLGLGFGLRDNPRGIGMLWAGALCMLVPVFAVILHRVAI